MKRNFIAQSLILFSILLLLNACNSSKNKASELVSKSNNSFMISSIDSIDNYYIVYAKRNDSIFKIASKKNYSKSCVPIEALKKYNMNLTSAMGDKAQKLDIAGIKVDENTLILLEHENNIIHDLFYSQNLIGLCYNAN